MNWVYSSRNTRRPAGTLASETLQRIVWGRLNGVDSSKLSSCRCAALGWDKTKPRINTGGNLVVSATTRNARIVTAAQGNQHGGRTVWIDHTAEMNAHGSYPGAPGGNGLRAV